MHPISFVSAVIALCLVPSLALGANIEARGQRYATVKVYKDHNFGGPYSEGYADQPLPGWLKGLDARYGDASSWVSVQGGCCRMYGKDRKRAAALRCAAIECTKSTATLPDNFNDGFTGVYCCADDNCVMPDTSFGNPYYPYSH